MSEPHTVELSETQIKLLQHGLQYVKRSRMFETEEPSDEVITKRNAQVAECVELDEILTQSLSAS